MLLSFSLILILGLAAGRLCSRLKLPPLMGMLLVGISIGPSGLNLLDDSVLAISSQLRRIALIMILLKAGLNLRLEDLKKVGRPAVLMCFVPASFEILGMVLLAPRFFGLSVVDSLILGTVVAAVSPAVVVPHMLKIIEEGRGTTKGIPQMILAGASADDVFVIVLFTSFIGLAQTGTFDTAGLLRIPTSILFGIAAGAGAGTVLHVFTSRFEKDIARSLILYLCMAFLLVTLEDEMTGNIGFSGLIAVMVMGMTAAAKSGESAASLSRGLSELWKAAEVFLFVLVGAAVDIRYAFRAGPTAILLIFCVLLFRMTGVAACMTGTALNRKERLFCMIAYCPKATVQAAIGAIPLSMGLSAGSTILTVAVVAILVTASLGAFLIDLTYKRFLDS